MKFCSPKNDDLLRFAQMFPSALAWCKARAVLCCLDLEKFKTLESSAQNLKAESDFIINTAFYLNNSVILLCTAG